MMATDPSNPPAAAKNPQDVTQLLMQVNRGNLAARSELYERVEAQLRRIANGVLTGENPANNIHATELMDEAFLRLLSEGDKPDWNDRKHFFRVAAKQMRRFLVDRARKRRALKRGGPHYSTATNDCDQVGVDSATFDILALDEALKKLAEVDERQAEIIEYRHFGGYSVAETADLLDVSESLIKQEFRMAKMWLRRELS